MIKVINAAKYFVYLSYGEKSRSLTPLKLQKLLYLAQGWSYVWDDKPLFMNDFEAWQYGPVCVEAYNYFKGYHGDEIPESEGISSLSSVESEETIKAVWDDFSDYTAYELVELTHRQDPWIDAYKQHTTITKQDIKHYFQSTF
ncbi:MAG TPA: DUF4065 domain-containing protein [Candidatus Mediterraneibacter vanvlietii]|nr:DUF4065 domain-containing protein [Candidatus Mediterraneibacter vanvlietii]